MPTMIKPLNIRLTMGRDRWRAPQEYGPAGWMFLSRDGRRSIIVSQAPHPQGTDMTEYIHASITGDGMVPSYAELSLLKRAVWGPHGEAYQVFPPVERHVNIHDYALHLWGRADGRPILPRFDAYGSI